MFTILVFDVKGSSYELCGSLVRVIPIPHLPINTADYLKDQGPTWGCITWSTYKTSCCFSNYCCGRKRFYCSLVKRTRKKNDKFSYTLVFPITILKAIFKAKYINIYTLFYGLRYNTHGYFYGFHSFFSSLEGLRKNASNKKNVCAYCMLSHRLSDFLFNYI